MWRGSKLRLTLQLADGKRSPSPVYILDHAEFIEKEKNVERWDKGRADDREEWVTGHGEGRKGEVFEHPV